jgi:GT2 family glycosyltransferase
MPEGVELSCNWWEGPSPRVCTIVLNYNDISNTIETLKSVDELTYENNSLLLVENSTEKEIIEKIRSWFPSLEIIENEGNQGYAGGNNIGMRRAIEMGADYIFLLNNDVMLEKGVLEKLTTAMESAPECAACQPIIAYFHDNDRIWSAGTEMYFGYPRLFWKGKKLQRNGIKMPPFGLVGCALFLRASALKKIGLFDESLFLMQEETDWCIRAVKMGYQLLVVSNAVVYHKVSETLGLFSKTYLYYVGRNWLLVGKRYYRWHVYGYILLTEVATRIPYYLYRLARKGRIGMIRFYFRGLRDGLRGVSGERKL